MDWIVIGALYVLGFVFFHLIGGLDGAADAFERWGRARAEAWRNRAASPSS